MKVKVLFLFYADPYLVKVTGGGLARQVLMHMMALDKLFDVYVISTQHFKGLNLLRKIFSIKIYESLPHIVNFIIWIFSSITLIIKLVKKLKINVIIAGGPTSPVILIPAYMAKKIFGNKVLVISLSQLQPSTIRQRLYAQMLNALDAIICSTKIVCRSLKQFNINKPMYLTGYGILAPQKPPQVEKKDIDFVFLGRLTKEKGGYDLIKIAEIIVKKVPPVTFAVVGDAEKEIIEISKRKGLPINFVGHVKHSSIWEYLARSKVMIYPSRYDSFAISVAEAMWAGLPVIAWNIPPFNEEYAGSGIMLVEPFNHEKFAEEAIKILSNPKKLNELGVKNSRYAQKFKWSTVYKRFKRALLIMLISWIINLRGNGNVKKLIKAQDIHF